jgi:hypothetical protein
VPASREPKSAAWVRNPIDAFVLAKHEEKGLKPAPQAERRVLLRRLSFDLTGLPATPEELDAFEMDHTPTAYEKQVERLLASPAYGERWGRHWLDVARYADSEGYESDHVRPYAWRYRDWVVKAFNSDRPFDRFVREQLAGDEITPYSDENLIATGFLAAGRMPGDGATGSSTPSTTTCPSMSSPSSSLRATSFPTPPWSSGSPPASTGTR